MIKKRNLVATMLLLICISTMATAQNRYDLTVREAVDLAFKNMVDVKNARLDLEIQKAKNKEITGQVYPQVSVAASVSHYFKLPVILFPDASEKGVYDVLKKEGVKNGAGQPITTEPTFNLAAISFQQPWNASLGGTVTQLLFQPDVFVALQARTTTLNYYQSNIDIVKEQVKDSAYKRYYAILIAEKQREFIRGGVQRLQKLYHDDSVMYKNGFAEKLDLDKVQVQLTNLQTTENVLNNGIKLAYAALKYSIGVSQKDTVTLKEGLLADNIREDVLDESFRYEDRVEIVSLGYSKRLQQLNVKRYKLGYIPTLSASFNYGAQGMGQEFISNKSTTWFRSGFAGLNLNVPIFDGFQRKYRVKQAQLDLQKVENTIDNVKQVIDLQQTVSRESVKNALLNLDAQERNMQLAENVYNTTKKKFEQGLGSSFEVLQADNDWQTAQSNYFNALYNAIVAKIDFQAAIGKLP